MREVRSAARRHASGLTAGLVAIAFLGCLIPPDV